MDKVSANYLTKDQLIEKYPFITENMLKNLFTKNTRNIRSIIRKLGRRIIIDENKFLEFLENSPSDKEYKAN